MSDTTDVVAGLVWLFDIGSTYTKLAVLDLDVPTLVARSAAPTTVDTDVSVGLREAAARAESAAGVRLDDQSTALASSSAAGGLRMAVIGLVPTLTVQAASQAALGAGAKIVGTHSFRLGERECEEIRGSDPDIILLAGGTDGGNRDTIVANAQKLASLGLEVPVVVAGNKDARDDVLAVLRDGGTREVHVTDNILPTVDRLNVEPVREVIREVFISTIIHAKGINRAQQLASTGVIMPTPVATLAGATLLADGTADQPGLGELVAFEIGGATTNVHSVADGQPSRTNVIVHGLPTSRTARTVEGDLGLRWSAPGILDAVGGDRLAELGGGLEDVERRIYELHSDPPTLPSDDAGARLDVALAASAIQLALRRHAGRLQQRYTPNGPVFVQEGKDLSAVGTVIGTGGVVVHSPDRRAIFRAALDDADDFALIPRDARCLVDADYLLYAAGLLARRAPEPALEILKAHLEPVE